jgi:hypothetical protein
MELFRELLSEMCSPRTLKVVIYVLTVVVCLKAISVYYGFSWATALAAQ